MPAGHRACSPENCQLLAPRLPEGDAGERPRSVAPGLEHPMAMPKEVSESGAFNVAASVRRTALTTPMITKGVIHQVESATVRDRNGASVGKVVQVFPSDEDGSAAYFCVATGLLGRHQALVPADDATFDGTDVHVGYTKDAIKGAPSLGAGRTLSLAEANDVRRHFGLSRIGAATGDMGDPHENLDQAGTGLAGADDTEGAGTTPPA